MMTFGLLCVAMAAPTGTPLCEMTYASADGPESLALRVMTDGNAEAELRGHVFSVMLTPDMRQRLERRLNEYDVCTMGQAMFDRSVAEAARYAGLNLPIPYADTCEISLASGSVRCGGSSVLATRLPEHRSVQEFERLRADLEQVRAVVILGGPQRSTEILQSAGETLGRRVRLSTLVYADTFNNESVAHFRPDGQFGALVIVSAQSGRSPVTRIIDAHARQ